MEARSSAAGRVVVVGAGAIGSLLAALLSASGREVDLIDRHAADGTGDSVAVVDPSGRRSVARVRRVASVADVAGEPDLVVLAVKQPDLAAAVASLERWPRATVLTIQNGVGAEEAVVAARPAAGLVAGSITAPVERLDDGAFAWRGRGGIALAAAAGPVGPLVDDLVRAFSAAKLPARRLGNAPAMKWSKLLANLPANATCALLDTDPAAVYADPRLFDVERRQILEAAAVMSADVRLLVLAARLPAAISRLILRRVVAGARGGKPPSLQLHLRRSGGPSEVGWMNGAVARAASRSGVPAPVNARLAELVEAASADPALRTRYVGRPNLLLADLRAPAGHREAGTPSTIAR